MIPQCIVHCSVVLSLCDLNVNAAGVSQKEAIKYILQ